MKKLAFLFILLFSALCLASCAYGACEHEFGEWKTTSVADCTTIGTQARICSRCKKTEVEKVNPTGHKFAEKRIDEIFYKGKSEDGNYDEYYRQCKCGLVSSETFLNEPESLPSSFAYTVINEGEVRGIRIDAYVGKDCDLLIPHTIGGIPVIEIADKAFQDCDTITSVNLPDVVLDIGEYAFYNCVKLVSVTIPDSVTSIGVWAFANCSALESVIFEDTSTWYRISIISDNAEENWQNKTGGTEIDVIDPEDAAFYLGSAYYWYKL